MAILIVTKNGKSYTREIGKSVVNYMRYLHHARKLGLTATIETTKATYYLNNTKLAKVGF